MKIPYNEYPVDKGFFRIILLLLSSFLIFCQLVVSLEKTTENIVRIIKIDHLRCIHTILSTLVKEE